MHPTRFLAKALCASSVLALTGCSGVITPNNPPPSDYVGVWRGEQVLLVIDDEGMMHYESVKDGYRKTMDVPILSWEARAFEAGVGPLTARFEVDDVPHEEDGGVWMMTLDGVDMERSR